MDRTVDYLLRKYETKDVNEIWTTEHELEYKRNQRHKNRLYQLDIILNNLHGSFRISRPQKDRITHLLKRLDFSLMGTFTEEQIIVMTIIYVKLESKYNSRPIQYYPLLEEYGIPVTTFISFLITLNKFHLEN